MKGMSVISRKVEQRIINNVMSEVSDDSDGNF